MSSADPEQRLNAEERRILDELGLEPGGFILATVHRAANTDDAERLGVGAAAV